MSVPKDLIEKFEFPICFTCVDCVLMRDEQVIFIKKKNNDLLHLPGGFVDPSDLTIEDALHREMKEEVGVEIDQVHFQNEFLANDGNRYNPYGKNASKHRVRTSLFTARVKFNENDEQAMPVAGDDAVAVELVDAKQLMDLAWAVKHITPGHIPLLYSAINLDSY